MEMFTDASRIYSYWQPFRGKVSILMEMFPGMDYSKLGVILNGLCLKQSTTGVTLEKSVVKMLLSIAQSDLLSRKVSRRANTILQKFPNIGESENSTDWY